MADEVVLATVSWRRLFLLALGPFGLIGVLAIVLSPKSVSELMSVDNWTQPTFIRPYPLVGLACLAIYVGLIFVKGIKLLNTHGKLVWANDGHLMVEGKRQLYLSDIEPTDISFDEGFIARNMTIGTVSGTRHVVRLSFADYDIRFIKDEIHRLAAVARRQD